MVRSWRETFWLLVLVVLAVLGLGLFLLGAGYSLWDFSIWLTEDGPGRYRSVTDFIARVWRGTAFGWWAIYPQTLKGIHSVLSATPFSLVVTSAGAAILVWVQRQFDRSD